MSLRRSARGDPHNPKSVTVTTENRNVERPLTFLKVESPFDPISLGSGVFTIHDLAKDEIIASPGLKVSRMLPPSREDLVEVPPQRSVTQKLELKAPWIPADGRNVRIGIRGGWRAVWPKSKTQVDDAELQAVVGEDMLKGPFQSKQALDTQL